MRSAGAAFGTLLFEATQYSPTLAERRHARYPVIEVVLIAVEAQHSWRTTWLAQPVEPQRLLCRTDAFLRCQLEIAPKLLEARRQSANWRRDVPVGGIPWGMSHAE